MSIAFGKVLCHQLQLQLRLSEPVMLLENIEVCEG
jgi:hypothetical protein